MAKEWIYTPNGPHRPAQANFQCPHCGLHSVHSFVAGDADYQAPGEIEVRGNPSEWQRVPALVKHTHWIMRWVNCGRDTYFLTKGEPNAGRPIEAAEDAMLRCPWIIVHQYPIWVATAHDAVPVAIAGATDEAERSATGRDLYAQLKDLKDKQLITPDLHEWADSLRVLGRDGAHPEFPEVAEAKADDGVNLLHEIIRFVYILPYERAQKRKKNSGD